MGQKSSKAKAKVPAMEGEMLETYIRSEFRAMDSDNDSKLSRQEVLDLLILLGYSKGKEKLKALHVKTEDSVELEDYVTAFKADKALINKTMKFRQLFQMFDKNKDGTVSKEEMISGLEEVDIKVDDELKKTIEKMDANDDGKITYEEFLTVEFKIALKKDVVSGENTDAIEEKKEETKEENKEETKDESRENVENAANDNTEQKEE